MAKRTQTLQASSLQDQGVATSPVPTSRVIRHQEDPELSLQEAHPMGAQAWETMLLRSEYLN